MSIHKPTALGYDLDLFHFFFFHVVRQGCFSYDRDVANCTATLVCKLGGLPIKPGLMFWWKGAVPVGWFPAQYVLSNLTDKEPFLWYLLIQSVKSLSDLRFTTKWIPWSDNLICSMQILALTVVSCFAKTVILYRNCSWYWDIVICSITSHTKKCRHGDAWSWNIQLKLIMVSPGLKNPTWFMCIIVFVPFFSDMRMFHGQCTHDSVWPLCHWSVGFASVLGERGLGKQRALWRASVSRCRRPVVHQLVAGWWCTEMAYPRILGISKSQSQTHVFFGMSEVICGYMML